MLGPTDVLYPSNKIDVSNEPYDWVWLRDPVKQGKLFPPYLGPYKVIRRHGPVITIDRNGTHTNVNIDQTQPAYAIRPQTVHIQNPQPNIQNRTQIDMNQELDNSLNIPPPPQFDTQISRRTQNTQPLEGYTSSGRQVRPVDRFC